MENEVYEQYIDSEKISKQHLLLGLLNRFDNRYQAAADAHLPNLSWNQVFFLKGLSIFKYAPNIRDMSNYLGCSHQNANQILKKLISMGFVVTKSDESDKRMLRLFLTEKAEAFLNESNRPNGDIVKKIFSCVNEDEMDLMIDIMTRLDCQLNDIENLTK